MQHLNGLYPQTKGRWPGWRKFPVRNIFIKKHQTNIKLFGIFHAVHSTKSGFRGLWWGGNPYGIHLAAGPDWMHLMHEGLGKHLLTYICAVLKKSGRNLEEFYKIHRNNIKVFFCFSGKLKKNWLVCGRPWPENQRNAKRLEKNQRRPRVDRHTERNGPPWRAGPSRIGNWKPQQRGPPERSDQNVQRAIYYYLALQRERERDFPDEKSVEVGHSKTVLHISQWMFHNTQIALHIS